MVAPSSQHSTAPPEAATIHVSFFPNKTDTRVLPKELPLDDLVKVLSYHFERADKDGPMFACVRYAEGETRSNDGVVEATAFVLDVDEEPTWALIEPYHHCAFTSHSHGGKKPIAWRIVLFIAAPILNASWDEAWARVTHHLCPNADPGAKALSQPHYRPSCLPGAPHATRNHTGALLDWTTLEPLPPPPPRQRRTPGARQDRPGDDFNARADWADDDLLGPTGAVYVSTRRDGTEFWRRPGKDDDWSATINYGGSDTLYVFSSHWPPFEPRRSYDKFGAYAALHHGGTSEDAIRRATKALADLEYGRQDPELKLSSPNGNGHHTEGAETAERIEPAHLTDLGNSQRFVARFGADVRYCALWGAWLLWDGQRWAVDQTHRIQELAKAIPQTIDAESAASPDKSERKALRAWATRTESAARLESMLTLARSSVAITPDQLDQHPWLLNVQNGTLDLRDGALRGHGRTDYLTKLIPIAYSPAAAAPQWEAFLARVQRDAATRAYLQRAAGYSATGSARERKLIVPHGTGKNGKGVYLQTLRRLLGEYAVRAPSETFLAKRNDQIPNDVAQLRGARFVFASESDDGRRLAEATVKDLTGGEDIPARFLRQEWFSFRPTFTPWLATNHKPEIRGTDPAIWDRIDLVPFPERIPDAEQDPTLGDRLVTEEAAGILAWIVAGAVAWYRDGLGAPEAVRAATAEYRGSMDVLGDFLAACCVLEAAAQVTAKALYKAYRDWAEQSGEKAHSQTALGLRLRERGLRSEDVGRGNVRTWFGVGLRQEDAP